MANSATSKESDTQQDLSRVAIRRYDVERSCIRCHQKKTRCNKSAPCSACIKSDKAQSCRYPGPERVRRKSRKPLSTTLVQQIERLEQIVSDTVKHNTPSNEDDQSFQGASSCLGHKPGEGDPSRSSSSFTGLLIKDGNLVRYVNDHVLSHILEKEDEIRSAMSSPPVSSSLQPPAPAFRPLSLLHSISQNSYTQDLEGLVPTRRRAINLWQVFILNVDPIIKLLHIPTIQPIIYAAINEPQHVAPELHALLFAIYFSALTSTLRSTMGSSNETDRQELEQFKRGLEISLSQGDFLDQPTMYSLQAMTIFMGAFRCFGSGRSIWTMNGTIIRVAQLMGVHKDGKLFNLSPFDQEMRRRLWWKIVTADSRTLEDQGIWITGNRSLGDSRMPLNIDDRNIEPETTTIPPEHAGFTEMTPLISICHIQIAGETVAQLSLCADLESYSRKLPDAREAIARTRSELEQKFFCDYNPHIPIQRLFRNGTKMVLDKLEWRCQEGLLRYQQQSDPSALQREGGIYAESDELFQRACDLLDKSLELMSDDIYTSFAWHSTSYLPYELLTFILWRLYVTPIGSSADGAWYIVSRTFSVIEEASLLPDKGPRWTILCKLKEKVANLRANSQGRAEIVGSPNGNLENAGTGGSIRERSNDGNMALNGKTWDPEDLVFSTDWATFQQNLNMDWGPFQPNLNMDGTIWP